MSLTRPEYSLLLKLYKLQLDDRPAFRGIKYSLLLKLYKLQRREAIPPTARKYSLLLKLYKLQRNLLNSATRS